MVQLDVQLSSKEWILKALADHLHLHDRAQDAVAVENALWEREKTYSTGLGYGLAIPHCTCPSITANTITVMRLAQPVCWEALDNKPVTTVILLAHSQGGEKEHLQVFARLSRLLMRSTFRGVLLRERSAETLSNHIAKELGLNGTH